MRVAFLHNATEWSGAAQAFAVAARAFAEAGDGAVFIVPSDSRAEERLGGEPLEIATLEPHGWWLATVLRIAAILRRHRIEVVFVHTEREHLAAAAASRISTRCAIVRRTGAGASPSLGWRTRFASRLAPSAFLFTGEQEARAALVPKKLGPSVAGDISLSARRNGERSAPRAAEDAAPRDPHHIICIYDGVSRGRTALPIRTVALLAERHPEIRLTIVGPGSDAEEIRMHVASLEMLPRVDLLGERDDLPQLMEGATFGWVASHGDEAAFAMVDLMAAGLPVIAPHDPVARHYIADGITGIVIEGDNASLAAGALAGVLGRPERIEAMADAAKARVAREFSAAKMLEGLDRAARAARAARERGPRAGE